MTNMSDLNKSMLSVDGNHLNVSMPFAKVDKEKRLVSGWATLNNVDTQGDVVLPEASVKAFARARGNIREMHQPLAVGRMVDFKEGEFFDKGTKKFYRGIFVTARISKGAEDTWEKVLDGTLAGFSIGGEINDASNEFVKEAGKSVRFVKDYDLVELSLVDNPANQLANVESFQKNILSIKRDEQGSITLKGMAVETDVENVFVCLVDDTVVSKDSKTENCPSCDAKMENIGWIESSSDRVEKVNNIVADFFSLSKGEESPVADEGGVIMPRITKAKEEETPVEAPVPEGKEVSSPNPSETHEDGTPVDPDAVETVEDEADKEKENSPENDISKSIQEFHSLVKQSLEESKEETLEKVSALEAKIQEATDEFLEKARTLEKKIDGFGERVETQKNKLAELEGSLNKMNRSEALKKSAEIPAETNVQKESFWGSAFSS